VKKEQCIGPSCNTQSLWHLPFWFCHLCGIW